ncbi:MAG: RHS repeat-associated core domain-containing protein [Candidatus Electrothrix sp. LOE2]|nr:RHS repeat-associated core domain-containing protein [Candidatus Electrothrix sp. LOE2]
MDKRDEYVFDGLDPVAEYNMLNGQHTDYYRGAGGHLALMHQYKGGTQGQMYWYHYNNKGDVVGLTKQNGNSHHNYRYDPYGAVLPENGNFTDPHNHYTLTGKEFDENTGLVWFGARHYEPETGVWMGQDTYRGRLNDPASLHRFMYVNDNPVSYWDWYGYTLECPDAPPINDPAWGLYDKKLGKALFHCTAAFKGFIEHREENDCREDRAAECFYDKSNQLINQDHKYSWCGGSSDEFVCNDKISCFNHTVRDNGGIMSLNGAKGLVASRLYNVEQVLNYSVEQGGKAVDDFKETMREGFRASVEYKIPIEAL